MVPALRRVRRRTREPGTDWARTAICRWRPAPATPTGWPRWTSLCADVRAHGADALVVSLGLDAAASDPESPLRVSADGYRQAAARIGALGPTVVVQEGGYDLAALGGLVVAALAGLRDPAAPVDPADVG